LGAGVVWLGRIIHGLDNYDQSIFVNAGTAIALVGPVFVMERLLSRRIADAKSTAEEASSSVREAVKRVDALSDRVRERLEELRAADADLRERAAGGEQSALVGLYDKAAGNRSIDRLGLRVAAPDPIDWWIRVRAVHRAPEGDPVDLVELSFEDADLRLVGDTVIWSPGERPEDVLVRLATGLQDSIAWPGDAAFDAEAILATVAAGLSRVIDLRRGSQGDRNVRQIIALVGDDWAITREGLDSLRSSDVWAESYELVGDSRHAFNRLQNAASVRGWDDTSFRRAFGEAERVHKALKSGE
jgi:hypothetical protein